MPSKLASDPEARLTRARLSLDGLSVGDAFGERFFGWPSAVEPRILARELPEAPWAWTDDTEMALSIVETLARCGSINQGVLASAFATRFDPGRGYGSGAFGLLTELSQGGSWRALSRAMFKGQGSLGNGGAMRVGPLGAYFAEDEPERIVEEARLSAEVTHAHPDGQAGAIATALAAATMWRSRSAPSTVQEALSWIAERTPAGPTREGLFKAAGLPPDASTRLAASALGTGLRVTSADTVPFSVWCAFRYRDSYEEALWQTVSGLGDRDTTCAIVGGIVALSTGAEGIPREWLAAREPLSPV